MTADQVVEILNRNLFSVGLSEADLQLAIAEVFDFNDVAYEREYRLDARSRLDFFIDGLAIEVKTRGGRNAMLRQVQRYNGYDQVREVLVITTRAHHLSCPPALAGKPVRVHQLIGI